MRLTIEVALADILAVRAKGGLKEPRLPVGVFNREFVDEAEGD